MQFEAKPGSWGFGELFEDRAKARPLFGLGKVETILFPEKPKMRSAHFNQGSELDGKNGFYDWWLVEVGQVGRSYGVAHQRVSNTASEWKVVSRHSRIGWKMED